MSTFTAEELDIAIQDTKQAIADAVRSISQRSGDHEVARASLPDLRDHLRWLQQEQDKLAGTTPAGPFQVGVL